jgi:hypothetical protein
MNGSKPCGPLGNARVPCRRRTRGSIRLAPFPAPRPSPLRRYVFTVVAGQADGARTLVRRKPGWRRGREISQRGSAGPAFLRDKSRAPGQFLVCAVNTYLWRGRIVCQFWEMFTRSDVRAVLFAKEQGAATARRAFELSTSVDGCSLSPRERVRVRGNHRNCDPRTPGTVELRESSGRPGGFSARP